MREILFKAKRLDNGEWAEGSLLQTTAVSLKSFIVESSCYTFDKWDWNECIQVDTDTICQYTGLTDRNGCKIWENDIVVDDVILGTVVWDVKNARFVVNDINDDYQDYSDWWNEVGVIGNIFDEGIKLLYEK